MQASSAEPDLHILARLAQLEKIALILVAAVAAFTLAFWCFPALAAIAPPGWRAMRGVTAAWMLVAVICLALSAPGRSPVAREISVGLGLAVLALPIIVLLSYTGWIPFHADRWPLRPWPQTIVVSMLAASCLPFIGRTSGITSRIADMGAMCFVAFALFLIGSDAFNVVEFVAVDRSTFTSPQILVCFVLLTFVVAARRAEAGGWFAILIDSGVGSRIARRVLPGVFLVPLVLFATLHYLGQSGFITPAQGAAIATPLLALAILAVVAWIGRRTNALERQLRRQSLTDGLTNVLNRRGFDTVADYVLRAAERAGTPVTAFFFDLDDLKRANDAYGHNVGSELIRNFAGLLVATFRKSDLIARVGGDEFVVLAAASASSMAVLLERLQRSVAEFNASGTLPCAISYSTGHSELLPGAGDLDRLVAAADAHMYAEKTRKRAA